MGHLEILKTLLFLKDHFFWPRKRRYTKRMCNRSITCRKAKSEVKLYGLYKALLDPNYPWTDVSMDFFLGFPRSRTGLDSIFLVVNIYSKMTHFFPCKKIDDATHVNPCSLGRLCRLEFQK